MGFWGIEVKPGKPYTYKFEDVYEKLHVTQATLGDGSSTKKSAIQCSVGEKTPVLLCSFLPEKIETCPLNLEFEGSDAVTFSVVGPRSVHLSGFLKVNDRDYMEDDGDQDSYSSGEDIAVTDSDDSNDYGSEYDYEEDFIDDDGFGFPPSSVPNSGVVIEGIVEDEKPVHENSRSKQTKKKKQADEPTENKNSKQELVAKSGSAALIVESEDEDGFPIASTKKINPVVEQPKSDAGEKMSQKATTEIKKKRRRDGSDHVDNSEEKDGSMEDTKSTVVTENNIKKKNKKQKQQSEEGNAKEVEDAPPVKIEEDLKTSNDKNMDVDSVEKKKKKKKKKSKTQESGDGVDAGKSVTPTAASEEKKAKTKASQVRTFANGLIIEELAMGKPDGKRASPGNKVSVHYIGKLKKDGSIFDSNIGKAPFKFRLGVGQVIKGWDVGVNGMRIGDKRRLTIPPSMGYGAKAAGKKIPPNSWLMFDVELVEAR